MFRVINTEVLKGFLKETPQGDSVDQAPKTGIVKAREGC